MLILMHTHLNHLLPLRGIICHAKIGDDVMFEGVRHCIRQLLCRIPDSYVVRARLKELHTADGASLAALCGM